VSAILFLRLWGRLIELWKIGIVYVFVVIYIYRDKSENVSFAQDMVDVVMNGVLKFHRRFRIRSQIPVIFFFFFGFRVDIERVLISWLVHFSHICRMNHRSCTCQNIVTIWDILASIELVIGQELAILCTAVELVGDGVRVFEPSEASRSTHDAKVWRI